MHLSGLSWPYPKILGYDAPQKHHLVDEKGNTIDITRLVPLLRLMGITDEDDDADDV